MTLNENIINKLAEYLENAELECNAVVKITDEYPDMDWDDAYAIQKTIRQRKLNRGNKVAGLKMGLTSFAKMKQMGVETPISGFITDYGSYPDGAEIDISKFIHPKVEAEIAVVTKTRLKGPGCHIGSVMAAIDFVLPAVEIIDSRYENFRFDLKSVIADNTSSAGYVTGGKICPPEDINMRSTGVVMEKNGQVVEVGAGAAVIGHPASSVAMLANMLSERGEDIPAGTFIMTGGITAAVTVEAGDNIMVRYQDLGTVSMRFV
ncbi:MAG TPA: 2-oxo-3-hexenedioate decarboxylase [Thiotrichaceae bacterium]|jgi:2-oxo-3-hexenedioate decarboxylase|nr:2-oxo-3-hexenedioate decarboxylase [Thiotrichaceae bacterium]HIM07996.1 2-oxo-3-hexenedioate decarboxylase [Gammaproteobacteria bacterium]